MTLSELLHILSLVNRQQYPCPSFQISFFRPLRASRLLMHARHLPDFCGGVNWISNLMFHVKHKFSCQFTENEL